MKLEISYDPVPKHSEPVSAVGWAPNNELYSASDDKSVLKWTSEGAYDSKLLKLDSFPTCMHWHSSRGQESGELFALGSSDGGVHLVSKTGRVERTVTKQHQGAVTSIRWNSEGTALATSGEDGSILEWSRTGHLRSKLVRVDLPIHDLVWSPDDDSILFAHGHTLTIAPLQDKQPKLKWKAHNGTILTADWNPVNDMIVSGGEDCRYNVWDRFGRILFSSSEFDFSITAVSWTPRGDAFAVASFKTLLLCDKNGWIDSRATIEAGSLLDLDWTSDGTVLAGAAANGTICLAHKLGKEVQWDNYRAELAAHNLIVIRDEHIENHVLEKLEFTERVVDFSLQLSYLIVATTKHLYIYSASNFTTPHIIEAAGITTLIKQCSNSFLIVNSETGLQIFSYDGAKLCSPRVSSLKAERLSHGKIDLARDALAIIDLKHTKQVICLDPLNGKPLNEPITLENPIESISISHHGITSERKLILIDANRDMWITPVHKRSIVKLAGMVAHAKWSYTADLLAAVIDDKIQVWYYLNVIYLDRDLAKRTTNVLQGSVGRNAELIGFCSSEVTLRKDDGAVISRYLSPYPVVLQKLALQGQWAQATKLARFVDEELVWACLAAMAVNGRELESAQIAFAAVNQIEKLEFIEYVKQLPLQKAREAELALLCHRPDEAEAILLKNSLVYRAIMLNIRIFRWKRALQLAVKHKIHVDTVLAYRNEYLEEGGVRENERAFIECGKSIKLDMERVRQKEQEELDAEKSQPSAVH